MRVTPRSPTEAETAALEERGGQRTERGRAVKYDRAVFAYHGCDRTVAEHILAGGEFKQSENDYDWLGSGIYLWEYGHDRALRFANEQRDRGKITTPAVIGAIIQLGNCFDLMDTRFTDELPAAFEMLRQLHTATGQPLPTNSG